MWKVCTSLYSASNVQAVRCHPSSPQENFVLGRPSMKQWYHLSIIHPLSHISPFLNAPEIFWYLHLDGIHTFKLTLGCKMSIFILKLEVSGSI